MTADTGRVDAAELERHTIERIERYRLSIQYPRTIGLNSTGMHHGTGGDSPIAVLHTDRGASGWGVCRMKEEEARSFIGRRLTELFDPNLGASVAAWKIDHPLHDLAGRILDLPVWRMLGAVGGQEVSVYSGSIYFDELDPEENPGGLERLLASCRQDAEPGYRHFKLKIGRGNKVMDKAEGNARDVEVTRLVRQHFPEARILVDGNDTFEPEDFFRYLEQVADCGLYWIEEPFLENRRDLERLREAAGRWAPDALIGDGEGRRHRKAEVPGRYGLWAPGPLQDLYGWSRDGLLDVLLMDVQTMGITGWRNAMPDVVASGAWGSPHAWGMPLKTLYAAQIAGGLGNVPTVEGVPGVTAGVDDSCYQLRDSVIHLPEDPGYGLEVDLSAEGITRPED